MKTNKSLTKRLRITKNGKIMARRPGQNHFNAKAKRSTQLEEKTSKQVLMKRKLVGRFLPNLVNKKPND